MDFLDQLKKEAEEASTRKKLEEADVQRRAYHFQNEARLSMRQLYNYLRELVETLHKSKIDIRFDYELEGHGLLKGYQQTNYMLVTKDPENIDVLTVQFECVGEAPVVFGKETRAKVKRQQEYMWSHGLRFTFTERMGTAGGKSMSGEFNVEPWIPVKITFEINELARGIRMTMKNLDRLEENVHSLKLEVLNSTFMEQLARAVVRKPHNLNTLLGFSVTDTLRMRLRSTLLREARQKQVKRTARTGHRKGLLSAIKSMFRKK